MNTLKRLSLQDNKRSLILSVMLYITSIVFGLVVALLFEPYLSGTNAEINNWLVSVIISLLLTLPFSKWYFEGEKVQASQIEGIKLGGVYLIIGLMIDIALAIPFMMANGIGAFTQFYTNVYYITFIIAMLFTTSVVGSYWEKRDL